MNGFNRLRSYSSGSEGSDKDYGYAHSQEFLVSLQQTQGDSCIRCHKKVYPTEKVEVGVQLHKNCFRCFDCGMTLSLNSYILAKVGEQGQKEVFCKSHAPKPVKAASDPEAIGIKIAVESQQRLSKRESFNNQLRLSDISGWEYDPKAIEFEHARVLQERNRLRRPPTHDLEPDDIEYEKGDLIRRLRNGEIGRENVKKVATNISDVLTRKYYQPDPPSPTDSEEHLPPPPPEELTDIPGTAMSRKFPPNSDYMEPNALWSPQHAEDPWNPRFLNRAELNDDPDGHVYKNINGGLRKKKVILNGRADHENAEIHFQNHNIDEKIYERLNVLRDDEHPDMSLSQITYPVERIYGHSNGNGVHNINGYHVPRDELKHPASFPEEHYRQHNVRVRQGHPQQVHTSKYMNGSHASHQNGYIQTRANRHPEYPKDRPQGYVGYPQEKRFIAQNQLELRQRHEHDAMIQDLEKARENQIRRLEEEITRQADHDMQDLVRHINSGGLQADTEIEKLRIEQKFSRMRGERMKNVMSNLSDQERVRIDDMIDRQTQEMLQLIDQQVPTKLPSPTPPKKKKRDVYSSAQIFDDVDFNAMQVAQYEIGSFTQLVYELTKSCKTALQKTRAIFKWLTFKDLNRVMFSNALTQDSPYYFLKGIKYGLESYHELFKRLCSYAGIPVKIIQGLSKSAGYRPGVPFTDKRFRNSWAAVYIDEVWCFVDCHWGARHITGANASDDPSLFCYELDEFFFLTDPADMIYMHFPDDPHWQLLDRPKTLEEFVNMAVLKSHFFHYGISICGGMNSVVDSDTGQVELAIKHSGKIDLAFNARLEFEGEELEGYCIHHRLGNQVIFNICLPRKGVFFLTLFACDKEKGDLYNNICAFRIVCTKVEVKPFCRFPRLPDGYGLTKMGEELGLSAEKYNEYYLVCNDDKMILNLKFRCPVRVSQKLVKGRDESKSNGDACVKNTDLDRMVFQRYKDHTFVSYVIRFPVRGIYILSLFAGYKESKSQALDCVCRYLIQNNKRSTSSQIRLYPKTLQYWCRCRLHEPTCGELKLNKNVKFKIEVVKAEAVAVIIGTQWFYLKKEGNTWEGVAHTGKDLKAGAEVYARYSDNDKDFFPLLEYKLIKDDQHYQPSQL